MAVDSYILEQYLKDGIPVLRVYSWSGPSFTYGVSQDPKDILDIEKCMAESVSLAGRMTGGGVLFHNDELTYSFVCSKDDVGEPSAHLVAYRQICEFLLRFYRSLGLRASFALECGDFLKRSAPSDLCAASHEKYDIVINGKKIGGNAQKRSRQAIFQHGSIPCSIDRVLERRYLKNFHETDFGVTTLKEELKTVPDKNILEDNLIEAFTSTFGFDVEEENIFSTEEALGFGQAVLAR